MTRHEAGARACVSPCSARLKDLVPGRSTWFRFPDGVPAGPSVSAVGATCRIRYLFACGDMAGKARIRYDGPFQKL